MASQQTQNINCKTFIQCWTNGKDVGKMSYVCRDKPFNMKMAFSKLITLMNSFIEHNFVSTGGVYYLVINPYTTSCLDSSLYWMTGKPQCSVPFSILARAATDSITFSFCTSCAITSFTFKRSRLTLNQQRELCYYVKCMPCHAMPCHAMPCHAMPCHAMPCHAMPCHAMPCHAIVCYAMLCYALLCYAMLCYAMLCYAMLCYAMLCYAMLCYAMLCYAMLCCWDMTPGYDTRT